MVGRSRETVRSVRGIEDSGADGSQIGAKCVIDV